MEEAKKAVYDRQIRLWGAEAQERIGESRALFVGFGGVAVGFFLSFATYDRCSLG